MFAIFVARNSLYQSPLFAQFKPIFYKNPIKNKTQTD